MPTALIVGAGIGRLAAALARRRRGWDVRIFERARSRREPGFALALAPNAVAVLRELGVASVVRRQLPPAEPAPRPSGFHAIRGVSHDAVEQLGDLSAE